jgi:Protein of unknown function (DUF455)
MEDNSLLPAKDPRARLMRYDTAVILKSFFFVEESLIRSQAGWIPATAPLMLKLTYARLLWEDSQTAEAMRQRVFELHYPSRLMSKEGEEPLIQLVDEARNAPSALAFYLSLLEVFKPALLQAYREYLQLADTIGDGPSIRFMRMALEEKERQIQDLAGFLPEMLSAAQAGSDTQAEAHAWVAALQQRLERLGGIGLNPVEARESMFDSLPAATELPVHKPFQVAQVPAREAAFHNLRFYWPDIIVPGFPYGEDLQLQLRSAISHLNEVWAVEACAAFTYALADELGWDFVLDASRWTYDESRHCRMGLERMLAWGFEKSELPLGTYIYDAAKDQDPIYRLGMLYFFETKNIHKKSERARKFHTFHDELSEHDMDFDWADETKHAHFGNLWLTRLLKVRGQESDPKIVRAKCHQLIDATIASASQAEKQEILAVAQAISAKAERLIAAGGDTPAGGVTSAGGDTTSGA